MTRPAGVGCGVSYVLIGPITLETTFAGLLHEARVRDFKKPSRILETEFEKPVANFGNDFVKTRRGFWKVTRREFGNEN